MEPVGLYVHIPFCRCKCAYCDFNSYAGLDALFEEYAQAVLREIALYGRRSVRTLYIGGGTPTALPLQNLGQILEAVFSDMRVAAGAEISIEANPGTVDVRALVALRERGVHRLSLGVQSFDEGELRLLGRIHSAAEAVTAFEAARSAGYDNVNLDLIYGLPTQSLASWQVTLAQALALKPEHLSLYALSVEEGTSLAADIERGLLPEPDPDLAARMYEHAEDALKAAGYFHYEISNWCRAAHLQCQHNLGYWRNEPYLGIGAGAHSWSGGRRWANVAAPGEYVNRQLAGERAVGLDEVIELPLEMGETMMMGLRLVQEGVEFERFRDRFGLDLRQRFGDELVELQELGLLQEDRERIRLTRRGRLLGNQVFLRFLPG
jgi:oxygen-independent coproporphyrinogen-3 oxidase